MRIPGLSRDIIIPDKPQPTPALAPAPTTSPTTSVAITRPSISGDEALQQLKDSGQVPADAILDKYDDQTGELTYHTVIQQSAPNNPNVVTLTTGETVDRAKFNALTPEEQATLNQLGIAQFNEVQKRLVESQNAASKAQYESTIVRLSNGEPVDKVKFGQLTPQQQSDLIRLGTVAFNAQENQRAAASQAQQQQFLATHSRTLKDEYIANDFLNELTIDARNELMILGSKAYGEWIQGRPLAEIYNNADWKPDFTQPEGHAYDGKPSWYDRVSAAGFIPTPANPIPPSQAYAGATAPNPLYPTDVGHKVLQEMKDAGTIDPTTELRSYDPITQTITTYIPAKEDTTQVAGVIDGEPPAVADSPVSGTDAQYQAYLVAAPKVASYADGKTAIDSPTFTNKALTNYLVANPGDTKTLKDYGFNDGDVTQANTVASQTTDAIKTIDAKLHSQNDFLWSDPVIQDAMTAVGVHRPVFQFSTDYYLKEWEKLTDEQKREVAYKYVTNPQNGLINKANMIADMVVPFKYTLQHFKEMGAPAIALSLALDVVSLVPYVGAAAAGAREVGTVGRLARLESAAKGVGGAILSDIRAPVQIVTHPIESGKQILTSGRDTLENFIDPRKIPEAVIGTSNGTVRLRVSQATTPDEAKAIRDTLMEAVSNGETAFVEVNGVRYDLAQSPFMKEVGGGLAHATPTGEAFTEGLTVTVKTNPTTGAVMADSEQGLFMANQPLSRFTQKSAFGATGEMPAFYVVSKDTAQAAITSDKIYQGFTEMERKFPVGTVLPAPEQTLYTRIGPQKYKVAIMLDKPLSPLSIAKLKAEGLIEDFVAPFKPAISITGTPISSLSDADLARLVDELALNDNRGVAESLLRNTPDIRATRDIPLVERIGGTYKQTVRDNMAARQYTSQPAVVANMGNYQEPDANRIETPPIYTNVPDATRQSSDRVIAISSPTVRVDAARDSGIPTTAPRVEAVRTDISGTDIPRVDITRTDTTRVDGLPPESGRVDNARTDTIILQPPRVDLPRTDVPRIDVPRLDIPRVDVPRIDVPRLDIPRVDIPRVDVPRVDVPYIDNPNIPIRLPSKSSQDDYVAVSGMQGVVEWRQGMWWVAKTPPYYDKLYYFDRPLPGTYKFATGKGSAEKTIQVLGGNPPNDMDVDIGIAIVHLKRAGNDMTIDFTRDAWDVYRGKSFSDKIHRPRKERVAPVRYAEPIPQQNSLTRTVFVKPSYYHPQTATGAGMPTRYYLGRKLRPASLT